MENINYDDFNIENLKSICYEKIYPELKKYLIDSLCNKIYGFDKFQYENGRYNISIYLNIYDNDFQYINKKIIYGNKNMNDINHYDKIYILKNNTTKYINYLNNEIGIKCEISDYNDGIHLIYELEI